MTETMRDILSRVLSQEIARQEIWKADAIKKFGSDKMDRDTIISEIKEYMAIEHVRFSADWYQQEYEG